MNKIKKYMAMAAAGILVAACTQDDALGNNDEVVINPTIAGAQVVQSRSTTPLATLNANAELVLAYGTDETTFMYDATNSKWVVKTGETPLYWDNLMPNDGTGYKFTAMAPADYSNGGTVADQSTAAAYAAADLLDATYTATTRKEVLDIELGHKMAQVVVNVTSTDSDFDLAGATLVIKGAKPGYNGSVVVTGDAANIAPLKTSTTEASFMAVLPAQALAEKALALEFGIKVAGTDNVYTWKNPDALTLVAGASTAIDLTVSKTGVDLSGVKVADWVDATGVSGTAQMVAIEATTFEDMPNVAGTLTLTCGTQTGTYVWGGTGITSTTAELYWENIPVAESYSFKLNFTPTNADGITDVKDILEATTTVTTRGGQPSFTGDNKLKHINSKLTIALAKGTDFPTGVAITGANIKLQNFSAVKLGDTETSKDFIMAASTTAIPAGTEIAVITLGGLTYTAKLTNAMTMTAGMHTTLTVALSPTKTTMAVAVKAWDTANVTGTAAVTITANSFTGMPNVAGTLTLKCGSQTGTYVWGGTSITSTTTELYWENIPVAASYSFTLTFTPTNADAVTNIKDILEATTTVTTRGGQPQFTGDNILKHTKARVTITLARGTGLPESVNLSTATVTLLPDASTSYAGRDFILEPTTITASSASPTKLVSVAAGNKTYNAYITSNLVLAGGVQTALAVTVNPTETTMAVAVADWGTPATFTPTAKVEIAASSMTGLPAGTLTLTYGSTGKDYTWDGTTLTPPTTPFYWENITGVGPYVFAATFTPTAADAISGVKDILSKTISVSTHGTQLAFTGDNALAHNNAKINVTLAKGGSYSDTEWTAITTANTTTMTFAGLTENDCTGGYDFTKTPLSAIFAPKSIGTTGNTITVSIPEATGVVANTLAVNLYNHMKALEAGKEYTVAITVDKTKVTVGGITVSDWGTPINGTGNIDY